MARGASFGLVDVDQASPWYRGVGKQGSRCHAQDPADEAEAWLFLVVKSRRHVADGPRHPEEMSKKLQGRDGVDFWPGANGAAWEPFPSFTTWPWWSVIIPDGVTGP